LKKDRRENSDALVSASAAGLGDTESFGECIFHLLGGFQALHVPDG
jgi:hypothetical protein